MKKMLIALSLLSTLSFGCVTVPATSPLVALTEGSRPDSINMIKQLDGWLEQNSTSSVTASVRFLQPLSPADVQKILEGMDIKPVSFDGLIDDPKTPNQLEEQIGTTPFTDSFSDSTTRIALEEYWGWSSFGTGKDRFEAEFASGLKLQINKIVVTGRADVLRNWWLENFEQIDTVVVRPIHL